MGCSNETCQLTGLTITCTEEPVALFVLKANDNYGSSGYSPVGFPIFGDYNDYRGIENVEPNKHSEMLREYIKPLIKDEDDYTEGSTIEDCIYHIERGHVEDHYLYWMHKSAYDLVMKIGSNSDTFSDEKNYRGFLLKSLENIKDFLSQKEDDSKASRVMRSFELSDKLRPFEENRENFYWESLLKAMINVRIGKDYELDDLMEQLNECIDVRCFFRGVDNLQKELIPKFCYGGQDHNGEEIMALYDVARAIHEKRKERIEEW